MTRRELEALLLGLTSNLRTELVGLWSLVKNEELRMLEALVTGRDPQGTASAAVRAVMALMEHARTQLLPGLAEALTASHALGTALVPGAPSISAAPLAALVQDSYEDLLAATRYVEDTTKDLVRALSRIQVSEVLLGDTTVAGARRTLANALAGESIEAIVYKNGSAHGLDDYADMLIRTKVAEAYQLGSFAAMRATGVEWVQISDGPGCGLDGHHDALKADGLVLTLEQSAQFPLSHPRCVRMTFGREDITSREQALAASDVSEDDYREVEIAVPRANLTAFVLNERTARNSSGFFTPGVASSVSAAERRNAARIRRAVAGLSTAAQRAAARTVRRG